MTNLEIIREACIKANPSILELKFGCIIRDFDHKYAIIDSLKDNVFMLSNCRMVSDLELNTRIGYEILGREIRLADVLLALRKQKRVNTDILVDNKGYLIVREKDFDEVAVKSYFTQTKCKWNLKNDNLELQSEETIKFLAELLK